jgi:D-beta-D-heptose 7-phosphate kinase/D-beta-D-heptose 1-phosphate adenosyltransferase
MTKSEAIQQKIFDEMKLMHQLSVWRFLGRKIVFTNGCFDILHRGHVYLLNKAAEVNHPVVVVVGLNTDASVKGLKGDKRPVNSFDDRCMVIASLYSVDAVIGFSDPTPLELIKKIKPDYLVKGGDYKEDEIVGADIVKANGGHVVVIPFLPDYSTTNLIGKLANS